MSLRFIPNAICVARMLLVAPLVLWIVEGRYAAALVVLVVAGLSDGLDGFLAKRFEWQTRIGGLLDPAADKLLLVTTFIVLTLPNIGLVNRIPLWLTILVISRDVGIVSTVAIVNLAVGPKTFAPSPLGKAATAIFILACVVVMLFNYLGYHSRFVDAAIWISAVITLASGVDYVWRIAKIINK